MNFIISSAELLKHLAVVAEVVPPKSVIPIVQNVLFHIDGNILTLTGTDLENSVRTSLAVDSSEGTIKIALPAKIILDTLKALPEQPITFIVSEDQRNIELLTANGKYKIAGLDGNDFPRIPPADDTQHIQMPLPVLVKAIDKTVFAVSSDDMKIAMTGVFFDFKTTGATFVSTDAHRLVRYRRSDVLSNTDVSFILPQKALKMLSKAASGLDLPVRIEYNSSNAFFTFGDTLLVCRMIDSKYPDYNTVIPQSSTNKLLIDKKELLGSIKRLDIYSNKSSHLGRFKLSGNVLTLRSEDLDIDNSGKETINVIYEGEEMEIGFNLSLVPEVINNAGTDQLQMEFGTPGRAVVVYPTTQEEHENLLMLVMPIMLNY